MTWNRRPRPILRVRIAGSLAAAITLLGVVRIVSEHACVAGSTQLGRPPFRRLSRQRARPVVDPE